MYDFEKWEKAKIENTGKIMESVNLFEKVITPYILYDWKRNLINLDNKNGETTISQPSGELTIVFSITGHISKISFEGISMIAI